MANETKKLACLLFAATLFGCSKETKPVAEDAKAPAPAAESESDPKAAPAEASKPAAALEAEPAGAVAAGQDTVKDVSFDLKIQPKGSYQAGQGGAVEIVLEAKQPFKVNKDYPYSFKLNESTGVSFPAMKIEKDAVELQEKQAVMKVGFTPETAGEHTISGTFKFSVCTEEQCLIKKHDLALAVNVQ